MGKLEKAMYGTRDAAVNLEEAYASVFERNGFKRGKANPCTFRCDKQKLSVLVHGDDFLAAGPSKKKLMWLKNVMSTAFESKHQMMGPCPGMAKSNRAL